MMGEWCVDALEVDYGKEALISQVRMGGCAETGTVVLAECTGIVMH